MKAALFILPLFCLQSLSLGLEMEIPPPPDYVPPTKISYPDPTYFGVTVKYDTVRGGLNIFNHYLNFDLEDFEGSISGTRLEGFCLLSNVGWVYIYGKELIFASALSEKIGLYVNSPEMGLLYFVKRVKDKEDTFYSFDAGRWYIYRQDEAKAYWKYDLDGKQWSRLKL